MEVVDNIIDHGFNVLLPDESGDSVHHDGNRHTFLAAVGADITGYDTDCEAFVGRYRSYHNPLAVQQGFCSNSIAVGDNACGALQIDIDLEPSAWHEWAVLMGIGKAADAGRKTVQEFQNLKTVHENFARLKEYWHTRLQGMTVQTPDAEFNSMTNMWSPFNCLITYAWSRAASLVYSGERMDWGIAIPCRICWA